MRILCPNYNTPASFGFLKCKGMLFFSLIATSCSDHDSNYALRKPAVAATDSINHVETGYMREHIRQAEFSVLPGTEKSEIEALYGAPTFTDEVGSFWYEWSYKDEARRLLLEKAKTKIYTIIKFDGDRVASAGCIKVIESSRVEIDELFKNLPLEISPPWRGAQ